MVGYSEHMSEWTTPWTDPASQELRTGPALSLPFHHHHPSLGPHASSAPGIRNSMVAAPTTQTMFPPINSLCPGKSFSRPIPDLAVPAPLATSFLTRLPLCPGHAEHLTLAHS